MPTLPRQVARKEGLTDGYRVVINDGVNGCEWISDHSTADADMCLECRLACMIVPPYQVMQASAYQA